MKGLVFTAFLDLVEAQYGYDMVDHMIVQSDLASGGAYTEIGDYPYTEIVSMVKVLSDSVNIPIDSLLKFLGEKLFFDLQKKSPVTLENCADPYEFLEALDGVIHAEVLKLYPNAEVPKIVFEKKGEDLALLHYDSCRPFAKLAEGLLLGCSAFFGNQFTVNLLDKRYCSENQCTFELKKAE